MGKAKKGCDIPVGGYWVALFGHRDDGIIYLSAFATGVRNNLPQACRLLLQY